MPRGGGSEKDLRTARALGRIVEEIQAQLDASLMTQSQLCKAADVGKSTFHGLMRGAAWADLGTISNIVEVLNGELMPVWSGPPPLPTKRL